MVYDRGRQNCDHYWPSSLNMLKKPMLAIYLSSEKSFLGQIGLGRVALDSWKNYFKCQPRILVRINMRSAGGTEFCGTKC